MADDATRIAVAIRRKLVLSRSVKASPTCDVMSGELGSAFFFVQDKNTGKIYSVRVADYDAA